jgi:hypothetical protein
MFSCHIIACSRTPAKLAPLMRGVEAVGKLVDNLRLINIEAGEAPQIKLAGVYDTDIHVQTQF